MEKTKWDNFWAEDSMGACIVGSLLGMAIGLLALAVPFFTGVFTL